jgi:hypothetical protein
MMNTPINEGVCRGECQSAETALSICLVAHPNDIGMFAVARMNWDIVMVELHSPLKHQCFKATFGGKTIELVSIGKSGGIEVKQFLSIQPMAFHCIKVIRR